MKPLKNNVIIAQRKKEKETESGIILTGELDDGMKDGVVVEVGPDVTVVEIGQTVIPDWQKTRPITTGDIKSFVVSEDDILAILE
jgi:co-chaperonin GroES (HSP10)